MTNTIYFSPSPAGSSVQDNDENCGESSGISAETVEELEAKLALLYAGRLNCFGRPPPSPGPSSYSLQQQQPSLDVVTNGPASESNLSEKEFYIPNYILVPDTPVASIYHFPNCPVLVFINSKSGGHLGVDLLISCRSLLNENQVFDLGKEAPDNLLRKIYVNLEKLKLSGDSYATEIQKRLRIIVAGGDGTANWLLGVISDLNLSHPPPVATIPLGTENNLPFSFGWGMKNPGTDPHSVLSLLNLVMKAKEMKIDSWHIIMRMRAPKEGTCDPIAPLELPDCLHPFNIVSQTDSLNMGGFRTFRGGFWNYFSMGLPLAVLTDSSGLGDMNCSVHLWDGCASIICLSF